MKLKYSKKFQITRILLGLFWFAIASVRFIDDFPHSKYSIIGLIPSLFLTGYYIYIGIYTALYINDDSITLVGIPSKTLQFDEIKEMKYFAGTYSIKTDKKSIHIEKSYLSENDLKIFEEWFNVRANNFAL